MRESSPLFLIYCRLSEAVWKKRILEREYIEMFLADLSSTLTVLKQNIMSVVCHPEEAEALNSTLILVPVTLRRAYDCCQVTAFRFKALTNKETKSIAIQATSSKSRRKHTLRQSVEEIRLEKE